MMIHESDRVALRYAQPLPRCHKAHVFNSTGRHIATVREDTQQALTERAQRMASGIGRGFVEYPDDD